MTLFWWLCFFVVIVIVWKRAKRKKKQRAVRERFRILDGEDFVVSVNKEHGLVGNEHYTDCVDRVVKLKREGKHDEAITLLKETIEATERESAKLGPGWGVAPWYYEQLAIIYRKEGLITEEVSVLERYKKQQKAPGAGPEKLETRLQKAKALLKKQKAQERQPKRRS